MIHRVVVSFIIALCVNVTNVHAENHYNQPIAVVAQVYIEMRTGPGNAFPVFYITERGDTVRILKQRTDWYKVRTRQFTNTDGNKNRNKEGWVHVNQIAQLLDQNGQTFDLDHPTLEDFTERDWEGGVMIGSFGGTDEISVYSSYHITRHLSLEASIAESFGNVSNGGSINFNIVHQPFPHLRYSPFFTLGGGVRKTEPKSNLVSTQDRTDSTVNVGVGLRIYMSQRLIVRLQYKNHVVLTSRDDDEEVEEWKIGLSAFF